MHPVSIIDGDAVRHSMKELLGSVTSITGPGMKLARMPDGSLLPTSDVVASLRLGDSSDGLSTAASALIKHVVVSAESVGPGCTSLLLGVIDVAYSKGLSLLDAGQTLHDVCSGLDASLLSAMDALSAASTPMTQASVRDVIDACASSVRLRATLHEALCLAGSESRLFVEACPSLRCSVERVDGHTFSCLPDHTVMGSGWWRGHDVRCLLIDGMIERVAEIDALLQQCHTSNGSMVIFAREFSDDVVNTLHVNRLRNTLDVIPVRVMFDVETANVLSDIAAVAGCDVISSLKGELISTVKLDDVAVVPRVTLTGLNATVVNPATARSVRNHLNMLQKKHDEEELTGSRQLIDQRMRSMAATSVVIRVPAGPECSNEMQTIDFTLRSIKSALARGVIRPTSLSDGSGLLADCREMLQQRSIIPTLSLAAALHYGVSLVKSLLSVGAAVVIQR